MVSSTVPTDTFHVVKSVHGQYSVWPTDLDIPSGWGLGGMTGDREECLAEIDRIWPDPVAAPAGAGDATGDTLLSLFERTVAAHGERPAVRDDHTALDYRELDERSSALAARLRGLGVGAEDRVAVYLERGVDVFVALLGILKSGAAYVAVDPRYPDERRDLMISGSGARLVLCRPGWAERLAGVDRPVVEWSGAPVDGPVPAVPVTVTPANAACVLFTSGTTGVPKGVVLEHRNLVNFATNPALPELRPEDRTGQISSLSFDAFHFETWCSFAAGAEIAVLPALADLIGTDLQRDLRRNGITALLAPTMAVNQLVAEDRDSFAPLRILHTGGDVVTPSACRSILSGRFRGRFHNLYGPTETTTACTAHPVTEVTADAGTVPIGRAVDGARLHVLGPDLQSVAPGGTGVLHVGGVGVGRGYIGQPGLTARQFLPDPTAADGSRMYVTGDLVRLDGDGVLEFVGRADNQVKIRGYRVEPGEVERALCQWDEVRDAAVLPAGTGEDRWLAAFVVPYDALTPKDVRAFAEAKLPDFMVPSSVLVLPEIPANSHGKRDWSAMQALLEEARRRESERVEPGTATEIGLAAIWEDLLAAEHVGADDDFFALGGHSLLAFRMQRRIGKDLGVAVAFSDIVENSSLRELAAVIDDLRDGSGE
ncbi:amino acid adenylation domain-containing protein [Kitasatospora sp. NPDC085895]|uniref:amino acid adenylation domain-containing protein n=1 Tax=Kitasatospora sp. NPDC085895 TaxID=3155057 RepID=UPI00344D3829